jgi:two-component system, LytTR family, sensor kinase
MKRLYRNPGFNNFFFQFILFIILNTSFSILMFLFLGLANVDLPKKSEPLGASVEFILFNNFLKGLIVTTTLHFYRASRFGNIRRVLIKFCVFAVLVYVVHGFVQFGISRVTTDDMRFMYILWSPNGAMIFRVISVLAAILVYAWVEKEEQRFTNEVNQKLEVSILRELKTRAELESLEAKVNPHFLYNALNSIHTLVEKQPDKAKEMIQHLSQLFRLSITSAVDQFHSIAQELTLVETYLAIEKVRFGERLKVEIKCPSEIMNQMIPRFLVQPLVENAIKHGTSKLRHDGHIVIAIQKNDDFIEIQVRDNGPAFTEQFHNGHGMQSVRDKVKLLGAKGSTFEITPGYNESPPIAGPWKHVGIKFRKL